jgi:transketolase
MPDRAKARDIDELKATVNKLSREIIEMTTRAGSGHPSSSLSIIDILCVLYFGGVMRYNPRHPDWPDRDRFILSKGHAVPALYAVLAEAGYFDAKLLDTLRQLGSPLEGHPRMGTAPGIEASTGSLGQGLSIGVGHALAAHLDKRDYFVYVIIGDGEMEEGEIWEAAMTASKYKLHNLTAILDNNQFQQTGPVEKVMPSTKPIAEKWLDFGWHVAEVDGHDVEHLSQVFESLTTVNDRPQLVIAHTKKGRGLSPFEKDAVSRKHGVALTEEEAEVAYRELAEAAR